MKAEPIIIELLLIAKKTLRKDGPISSADHYQDSSQNIPN